MAYEISRVGQAVNCFHCGMETVLFIPGLKPPYSEEQYTLEPREVTWGRNQFGIRNLAGVVANDSERDLDWVRIEFILYNHQDVPVGSTSDCLIGFGSKQLWKFQAPIAQDDAVRASEPLLSCEYGRIAWPPKATPLQPALKLAAS